MHCFVLTCEIKKKRGTRPDPEEIKHFINTVSSSLSKSKRWLHSRDLFNLNREFECVLAGLRAGFEMIFHLEEKLVSMGKPFKLQYVITHGPIEIPKRKGMFRGVVGSAFAHASVLMSRNKASKFGRFYFEIMDAEESRHMNYLFSVFQDIVDSWKPKDLELVNHLLFPGNYNVISKEVGKHRSTVLRRHRSLRIDLYQNTKEAILRTPGLILKKKDFESVTAPPEAFSQPLNRRTS